MRILTDRYIRLAIATIVLALAAATTASADDGMTSRDTARVAALAADPMDEAFVIGRRDQHVRLVIVKDPTLATIFSVGTPGLGQFYVGRWRRALCFLGGVGGAVVAAGVASSDLRLEALDYDSPARGGNGNTVVDLDEYLRWEDKPRGDFGDLSTGRKALVIGGLGTALGIYVWNIVDAWQVAREHNRALYAELTGMQVSVVIAPDGTARGRISLPL